MIEDVRAPARTARTTFVRTLAAGALAGVLVATLGAGAANAASLLTRDQALALAFPGGTTRPMSWVLTDAQAKALEQRAKVKVRSKLLAATAGFRGDSLLGVAFFDSRTVRTMPGVFMIVIAPDTTVARVDVVAFHEPPDYRPPARWLGLFARRKLNDGLWPRRDIRHLSGATLSVRAVTESVRLALASYEQIVVPELSKRAGAR